MSKVSTDYVRWLPKAEPSDLFPYAYNLYWIKSIDELKQILSQPTDYLAFDTETTGLNQEELDIVGYSFCLDGKNAYYVPVNHYSFGLGLESTDLIYNKMCNTKKVGMFNMRFDVRVLEYVGFKEQFNAINDKDFTNEFNELVSQCSNLNKKCPYDSPTALKEEYKLKLSNLPYYRYDMSKINTEDVQAIVYLVDTNVKYPSLKESEEWYLGWRGASFESTVSKAEDSRAITLKKNNKTGELEIKDMNFYYLTPEEAYEYAAIDALGTYLLGIKLQPFLQAAKTSGYLDIHCLMPLTRFENDLTLIDIKRLNEYSTYLDTQIKECQKRCWTTAGEEFNIGSGKETNKILKKLNINTGVYTKRGDMSTSKDSIKNCLDKLDKNDPHRQFLQDLTNYGTLIKQKSSYVDNIIDMATSNIYHKNRLRFSYKTCEVPSGRLAAGGDKKNSFFANCNIQNITKPHVTNHFAIPESACEKYYPDVWQALNDSGTREECRNPLYFIDKDKILKLCIDNNSNLNLPKDATRWCYRIYGWVFSDFPWLIPNVQELVVEGFIQDLNIRSTFLPDDGYFWVSLDFNAEEIRIPAIWSREPAWVDAFSHNKDVHKSTAIAIWGEENYNKDKRKKAKRG